MRWSPRAKEVLTKFAKAPRATAAGVVVPSKKSVAAKVATLTKQVKKLNKISYDKVTVTLPFQSNGAVTQPYYQYHINGQMNTWAAIFGSNTTDIINVDKVYVNNYTVDMRLTQDNEPDRIFYTVFLVSLKDQAADANTFDPATGSLQLLDSIHYQTLSTNGRILLNTKFFNIHSMKRFTMGGRAGDQSAPEIKDLSFKVVPKQKLIVNPRGNVLQNAAFTFPKDPSQNYYMLVFNDDSGADLQTNKMYVGGLANLAIAA